MNYQGHEGHPARARHGNGFAFFAFACFVILVSQALS